MRVPMVRIEEKATIARLCVQGKTVGKGVRQGENEESRQTRIAFIPTFGDEEVETGNVRRLRNPRP